MAQPRNRPRGAATVPRSEATVQRQAIKILKAYGVDIARQNSRVMEVEGKGGKSRLIRFGQAGAADATGTLPGGRRIDVEFKREDWRAPRPGTKAYPHWARQQARLQKLNDMGGVGFVVTHPEVLHELIPKLLAGGRVSVDEAGQVFVFGS